MIIYKRRFDEDDKRIVPDGGVVRVAVAAMDSTQRRIAAVDERVQHTIDGNKAVLAAARSNADKAQAWSDHFSEQREARDSTESPAHASYVAHLNDAWKTPNEVAA